MKAKLVAVLLLISVIMSSCTFPNSNNYELEEKEGTLISDASESENSYSIYESQESSLSSEQNVSSENEQVSESESLSESTSGKSISSSVSSEISSSAISSSQVSSSSVSSLNTSTVQSSNGETRAVWISYLEYCNILTGKTKNSFSNSISEMFSNLAEDGYNAVYVHVRSHCDSYYSSSIFPWSSYITGTESKDPGFDPLQIMVEEAHSNGLKIEAWVNPYRIKSNSNTSKISSSSPAYKWLGTNKVVVLDSGIFFNPADDDVIDVITDGVKEIVQNYDVDGIHFDDYFYPTTDESFDKSYYSAYTSNGGNLELGDWRRNNVSKLIKNVYSAIKKINPSCRFGVSPSGNINQDINVHYCDVYTWTSQSGYIDYICPQIYYGFDNTNQPFEHVLGDFNDMIKNSSVELIVGLAFYKSGAKDNYAGYGSSEWVNNNDIISREIISARNKTKYGGFALYRYDSIYNPDASVTKAVSSEIEAINKIL